MTDPPAPERDDDDLEIPDDDDAGLDLEVLRRRRDWVLTILALLLVLGVSIFTAYRLLRTPAVSQSELAVSARQAVKDALPGRVVQFGGTEELTIQPIGDSSYEVKGNALAITPEGISLSYLFTCNMERAPDGKWRPTKVQLNPLFPLDLPR
jgi:hypothetical protein